MRIITIQETKNGEGYCANVHGAKNLKVEAKDEVTALTQLVEKIKERGGDFIRTQDIGHVKELSE